MIEQVQRIKFRVSRLRFLAVATLTVFGALLLLISPASQAKLGDRMRLEPVTMAELSSLISYSDALHDALVKQDDEQSEVILRDMQLAAVRVTQASARLKMYEQTHLLKILESIVENLEIARNGSMGERRQRLSDVFNMAANLVRVYAVDSRFKIFFCSKDKVTWVQTKARGIYPFPEVGQRDCAIRAP